MKRLNRRKTSLPAHFSFYLYIYIYTVLYLITAGDHRGPGGGR